jgi:long-chain acyl-CoA synthetase
VTDPLIGDVCVIGNDRPYNVALIVPDPVASAEFSGDVRAAIASAVDRANARLARVEQIKRFHIVESPWLPGGDEVTPTMKLKRKAIDLKYAATIDALYDDKE